MIKYYKIFIFYFFPEVRHCGRRGIPLALITGPNPKGNKGLEPMTSSIGDNFTCGSKPLELTLEA